MTSKIIIALLLLTTIAIGNPFLLSSHLAKPENSFGNTKDPLQIKSVATSQTN